MSYDGYDHRLNKIHPSYINYDYSYANYYGSSDGYTNDNGYGNYSNQQTGTDFRNPSPPPQPPPPPPPSSPPPELPAQPPPPLAPLPLQPQDLVPATTISHADATQSSLVTPYSLGVNQSLNLDYDIPITQELPVTVSRLECSPVHISAESNEDLIDPSPFMFEYKNKFSSMVLTTESLSQDKCSGFASFLRCNRNHAIHCWQKQIERSLDTENSVFHKLQRAMFQSADSPALIDKKPITIKIEDDDRYQDPLAGQRCKRYLKGKPCKDRCEKLHRYPKEDGVMCLTEKLTNCPSGSKCNFVHEVPDSDSDDDVLSQEMTVGHLYQNKSTCQGQSAKVPKQEVPIDSFNNTNGSQISSLSTPTKVEKSVKNNFASASTVKVKTENINTVINSSSSGNSSITAITTTTTITEKLSNCSVLNKKRPLTSPSTQPIKKEKLSEDANTVNKVVIKQEPPDTELFKEETIEEQTTLLLQPVKLENAPSETGISITGDPSLSSNRVISIPGDYSLPSLDTLLSVTECMEQIVRPQNVAFTADDPYGKLCEYLARKNVPLLSEVNNPKLLVWDVHLRLFFTNLLGVTDVNDYLRNVEQNLANESFEKFIDFIQAAF